MKTIIASPKAPKAVGPYSQAVKCGDTLYISGTSYGYVTLPDLKRFLRNGKPQPINED